MVTGIIGRKLGMTQVFLHDGTAVPATVIKAGPCVVVQAKTAATDGYEAVQLGLVDEKAAAAAQHERLQAEFSDERQGEAELLRYEPLYLSDATEPLILFAVVFGLSMDYEVLLLSRVR